MIIFTRRQHVKPTILTKFHTQKVIVVDTLSEILDGLICEFKNCVVDNQKGNVVLSCFFFKLVNRFFGIKVCNFNRICPANDFYPCNRI